MLSGSDLDKKINSIESRIKKSKLTDTTFSERMKQNGFVVQVLETGNNKHLRATNIEKNYNIDFYEFSSSKGASNLMKRAEAESESKNPKSFVSHVSMGDSIESLSYISDKKFYFTSKTENTVITAFSESEYRDEILSVIQRLMYSNQ